MAVYAFNLRSELFSLKNPTAVTEAQVKKAVADVSKLMILPTDETPTMATVSDPSKLKDQPFFANAHAGDEVLIYNKAQKAVLYDPTQNKIVEVAPIGPSTPASPEAKK